MQVVRGLSNYHCVFRSSHTTCQTVVKVSHLFSSLPSATIPSSKANRNLFHRPKSQPLAPSHRIATIRGCLAYLVGGEILNPLAFTTSKPYRSSGQAWHAHGFSPRLMGSAKLLGGKKIVGWRGKARQFEYGIRIEFHCCRGSPPA